MNGKSVFVIIYLFDSSYKKISRENNTCIGFYYLALLDAAILSDLAHKAVTLIGILYIVVKYTGNLAVKSHYTNE